MLDYKNLEKKVCLNPLSVPQSLAIGLEQRRFSKLEKEQGETLWDRIFMRLILV